MAKTFWVGGNWKMNGTSAANAALVKVLNECNADPGVEVVVAPPACYVQSVRAALREDFAVAGQNCYKETAGAFTGEVSPAMLLDLGAAWVILGHSERRHVFNEPPALIGEKTRFALETGLKVVFCIGEELSEREAGQTKDVCFAQLEPLKGSLKAEHWSRLVIAYEPVWAIGTGRVATPEQAQETHAEIRGWLLANVSADQSEQIRIVYGGSVKGSNCAELSKKPDIDGFLVGGASLSDDFVRIINCRR